MDVVTIYETNDETEAVLYQSLLEEAGIAVIHQDRTLGRTVAHIHTMLFAFHALQVDVNVAERASRLLADYRAGVAAGEYDISAPGEAQTPEPYVDARRAQRSLLRRFGEVLILLVICLLLVIAMGWHLFSNG